MSDASRDVRVRTPLPGPVDLAGMAKQARQIRQFAYCAVDEPVADPLACTPCADLIALHAGLSALREELALVVKGTHSIAGEQAAMWLSRLDEIVTLTREGDTR